MIEYIKRHAIVISIGILLIVVILTILLKDEEVTSDFVFEQKTNVEYVDEYIYVDIKGYVRNPGVYKLEKGARLFQVINQAGGFLDDGDTEALNLSKKLYDQEVVYVPSIEEDYPLITDSYEEENNGIININLASKSLLETLPGIGPSTAQSIIDYREENGDFESVENIKEVSGIGQSTFESIQEFITIN